jgi:hypothetical protein
MLTWTNERPKIEGFYWARSTGSLNDPVIFRVYQDADDEWYAGPHAFWRMKMGVRQWAGPIPEPQEPDQCEHRIDEGDYCEACNRDYKQAVIDNAEEGGQP